MGWWESEHGILGDHPADLLGSAIQEIVKCYQDKAGRKPSQGEIADLIEFVSRGMLRPSCGDPKHVYDPDIVDRPCASEPGLQGVFGYGAPKNPGDLANVDPKTGTHYQQNEVRDVLEEQKKDREEYGGEEYEKP